VEKKKNFRGGRSRMEKGWRTEKGRVDGTVKAVIKRVPKQNSENQVGAGEKVQSGVDTANVGRVRSHPTMSQE